MEAINDPLLSTASISGDNQNVDRTAAGLQFQRYSMGLTTTGAALGVGRRVAPDPSFQFRSPPMSRAQFASGGNAREEL